MKKITTIMLAAIYTANIMAQVPNYVPTNGLIGWWPFTGNAIDSSGNGNHGTVIGATLTSDRFNKTSHSYDFDFTGVVFGQRNDEIYIPYDSILNVNNISVSVWVYPRSYYWSGNPNGSAIIRRFEYGYSNPNGQTWGIDFTQSSLYAFIIQGASNNSQNTAFVTDSNPLSLNTWHHIVFTYNGASLNLYLDGALVGSVSTTLPLNTAGNSGISIGESNQANGYWHHTDGKIDDVGIWNRALTQQEITALYGCVKNLAITPSINAKTIGSNATFTATTTASNPSYIWQSDFGQGFQTLNNVGQYSGTSTNAMSTSNVQLSNHMVPIRAISTSGTCKDTSNVAYVKITDTCITKINDTVKITKYDTVKVTRYDTIKVTDTLVINATLSGVSAPNNTNRLIIYPNPAKDHITIDYGTFSRMNGYTLKIVNTLGQIVFSTPINQQTSYINLSTWTGKGMYYVQIYDASNTLTENRKIVLQ